MLIKSSAQASLFKLLIFTLIFNAIPLPDYMLVFMPIWILMFLSQWLVINKNESIYFIALMIGLLIDIQLSDFLGQNSLALIASLLFINRVRKSFAFSNYTTQQIYIFVASVIYLIIYLGIFIMINGFYVDYWILTVPLINAIIWPLVEIFSNRVIHRSFF